MNIGLRILAYIAVAALGYASIFLFFYGVGLPFGIISGLPDNQISAFNTFYLGGGVMISLALTGVGVMNFFFEGTLSRVLFWLPLAGTALYTLGVLAYFSF